MKFWKSKKGVHSINIMGNPTSNVFAEVPNTYDFPETFLEYLLNLIKRLTHFNK